MNEIFYKINKFVGELEKNDTYENSESCNIYGIEKDYGPGIYFTTKGIIKRYLFHEKDDKNKPTGRIFLVDKKICPVALCPSRLIFVSGKYELELTDCKIKRMLTDDSMTSCREFKKFLQQFNREYWFDGDNDDVTKIHKYIVSVRKELNIKTEILNNQFGWVKDKFCPYEISAYVNDPVLKNLENSFIQVGSFKDWLEKTNLLRKNILYEIQFLTALASPLIKKFNFMPWWLHLSGKSSTAKTASMIGVASIYGNPSEDDSSSIITAFNTTIAGLENRFHVFNNLPVFLNDSSNLKSYINPSDLIYMAFEGKGRTRANKDESNRDIKSWKLNVISNGEKSLLRRGVYEGALKRCIQIEGRSMDNKEASKARRFFNSNYGHVGPYWINIIKKLKVEQIFDVYDSLYEKFFDNDRLEDNVKHVTVMSLCNYLFNTYFNKMDNKIAYSQCLETGNKILDEIEETRDSADMCNNILEYLRDFVAQNLTRFEENSKYERYGFFNDGNVCFFNNKLDEIIIEQFNYDPKIFKKELRDRGLVALDLNNQIKLIRFGKTNGRYPQFLSGIIYGEIQNNVIDINEKQYEKYEKEGKQIDLNLEEFNFQ